MAVVVMPAYRPDQELVTLSDCLLDDGYRVIIVDDGSGERYCDVFEAVNAACVILRHLENRGKGAAIKTALSYIKDHLEFQDQLVGVMDCDGQHLPEDMKRVFSCTQEGVRELVLGVRAVGKEMPFRSRIGNQITRAVFWLASGVKVSDTQTGLRAFNSSLIPDLLQIEGDRYEYEMNVLLEMARTNVPIREVSIPARYLDKRNSCSHFRVLQDSVRIYKNILKFVMSSFSSFLLDYLLFTVCMLVLPHTTGMTLLANIAARVLSAWYNYCVNCSLVFRTGKNGKTAMQYFELAGFILFVNNLVLEVFLHVLDVPVYLAKLCTECLLFLVSWMVQEHIIFKKYQRIQKG